MAGISRAETNLLLPNKSSRYSSISSKMSLISVFTTARKTNAPPVVAFKTGVLSGNLNDHPSLLVTEKDLRFPGSVVRYNSPRTTSMPMAILHPLPLIAKMVLLLARKPVCYSFFSA